MKQLYLLLGLFCLISPVWGQLSLTGTTANIDFTGFLGTGFTNPPAPGELSSEQWEIGGASDPYTLAGTNNTGDYARGLTTGGETGGGVYSYATGSDTALWIQPTGNDLTPGTITLYVTNNTGAVITDLAISYDVLVLNDGDRSNTFNFEYDNDQTGPFTAVPTLDLTSVEVSDASLTSFPRNTTIAGINIAAGGVFRLQWATADFSGGGNRDEFGLDNIMITVPTGVSPTIGFDLATSVVGAEGNAGSAAGTLDITMNTAPTGADVIISVDTTFSHTADFGVDFSFVGPLSLTFPITGTYPLTQTVSYGILGDTEVEAPEYFELGISITSGIASLGNQTHKVAITDDETPEGLVINEFSQGPSGSLEYIELLVVGTPATTVDLRNWILDDNSGLFSYGTGSQLGIADGHLRFSNDCNWSQVPVGSLILLYADDPAATPSANVSVTTAFATDDPTDNNADYVYVLGIDYGFGGSCGSGPASVYLETDCSLPALGTGYDEYSPASYQPPAWFSMQPRNSGDAMQIRKPDGTYFFGISWGDKGGGSSCPECDFNAINHPGFAFYGADALYFDFAGQTDRVFTFENATDNDFRDRTNWAATPTADATTETPGAPNGVANTAYINTLRQDFPVVDVDATITCELGPNQTKFFLADNPADEIILWLQNNTTTDHGSLDASTVYNPTHFQNTNITGSPYFLRKQFRANPTVATTGDNFDIGLFVSDAELADFATYLSTELFTTVTTADVLANLILYKIPGSTDLPSNSNGTGVQQASPSITTIGTDRRIEGNFTGGFSSFGLGVLPTALPVEGLDFQATLLPSRQVQLNWLTLSELNNDYFEVHHSADGETFSPIGQVDGAGTTQDPQHYTFFHREVAAGENFYQLKQVDDNGQFHWSEIVQVSTAMYDASTLASTYPNPAQNELFFSLWLVADTDFSVRLLSMDGRLVQEKRGTLIKGNQELLVEVAELPGALYLYEVKLNGQTFRGKWMKQ